MPFWRSAIDAMIAREASASEMGVRELVIARVHACIFYDKRETKYYCRLFMKQKHLTIMQSYILLLNNNNNLSCFCLKIVVEGRTFLFLVYKSLLTVRHSPVTATASASARGRRPFPSNGWTFH